MKWMVRLYPAWWRDRYGTEMAVLLDDLPYRSRMAMALDLLRGALDARLALAKEARMPSATGRSVRRAVLFALALWVALSVDILLTNVAFPTPGDDDGLWVLADYFVIFAVLGAVGYAAGRRDTEMAGIALSGAVAGAIVGFLTIGTFLVVDNVWLDIVAQQQQKIDGLARAGGGSMRDFLNRSLLPGLLIVPAMLGGFGAVLAMAGGSIARRRGSASGARI